MIKVYIASPYTYGDTAKNVRAQLEAADHLMNLGHCPIVPLFSHFQNMMFPRAYEDWLKIDFEKIKMCDVLLRLPGYSPGADKEVEFAKMYGIKVVTEYNEI